MQNCIHGDGANKIRMCGMEVCKLYEKYFPVNRVRERPFNLEGGMVFFLKKYSDSQCC